MSKPTIFLSHSSSDQKELVRLKELFVQKTGGSIDVFLSSDGQSIPLGRNWVHRIEEALEHASLMIVFVSPNSLRSSWLFFESGFAYSKGIRVVPIGFLGVDLGSLPPPLSLLQGFNITSEAGLNNLIALANEVFAHSHAESFTSEEFREVCAAGNVHSKATFGDHGHLIDQVQIEFSERTGLSCTPSDALDRIGSLLDREGLEHERSGGVLNLYGISFITKLDILPSPLEIRVDPGVADIAFPILERSIREVRAQGISGTDIRLDFVQTVGCIEARHKITGRIYGTDVKLAPNEFLIRGDIKFYIGHLFSVRRDAQVRRGATYIRMELLCDHIPVEQIRELLSFLFDREILFLKPELVSYVDYD